MTQKIHGDLEVTGDLTVGGSAPSGGAAMELIAELQVGVAGDADAFTVSQSTSKSLTSPGSYSFRVRGVSARWKPTVVSGGNPLNAWNTTGYYLSVPSTGLYRIDLPPVGFMEGSIGGSGDRELVNTISINGVRHIVRTVVPTAQQIGGEFGVFPSTSIVIAMTAGQALRFYTNGYYANADYTMTKSVGQSNIVSTIARGHNGVPFTAPAGTNVTGRIKIFLITGTEDEV